MALQNLVDLRDEIKNWSERNDLSDSQIDSFVLMVENDFKDEFYFPANEYMATQVVDANGEVGIPSDYLKAKHLIADNVNGKERVIYRKPFDVVVHGEDWITSQTLYFDRRGFNFIFAPDAPVGTNINIIYWGVIPSLLDTEDGQNFIINIMPTVYLFGALKHVHEFTFNEERAAFYDRKYQEAKANVISIQRQAEESGSTLSVFPYMSDNGYIL